MAMNSLEEILSRCLDVQECAVLLPEQQTGTRRTQRPIAYVVLEMQLKLRPSIGMYPLYDDFIYYTMSNDQVRVNSYKQALHRVVKEKVVVDVGTGQDALLARLCTQAGAKKVYAIEQADEAYQSAYNCIRRLQLEEKITMLHGDSMQIVLPELVDVCVSELIGNIGSEEGVVPILHNARRFLKENGVMIPAICQSQIAAVSLPQNFLQTLFFPKLSWSYAQRLFQWVGHPFDFRVCLSNLPLQAIISNIEVFEDIDFTHLTFQPSSTVDLHFTLTKDALLHGFLIWMELSVTADEKINTLHQETNWSPVYIPLFHPGIPVHQADRIDVTCTFTYENDGIYPDYIFTGNLIREGTCVQKFSYQSCYKSSRYRATPFYCALFDQQAGNASKTYFNAVYQNIEAHLQRYVPEYLLPFSIHFLYALPRTDDLNIAYEALQSPGIYDSAHKEYSPLEYETIKKRMTHIWRDTFKDETIGIHDHLMELGCGSFLATYLLSKMHSAFQIDLSMHTLLTKPTIAELSLEITNILSTRQIDSQ